MKLINSCDKDLCDYLSLNVLNQYKNNIFIQFVCHHYDIDTTL